MSKVDFKVILLGDVYTGKTSLFRRYTLGIFSENYQSTVGLAFKEKVIDYKDKSYRIGIWDTAGSERFASMTRNYYRGATAAVLCYDIFSWSSWDRAKSWMHELRLYESDCKIYLCGTKSDLLDPEKPKRAVNLDEAVEFAAKNACKIIEVSNKTGHNVDELFAMIVEDYINSQKNSAPTRNGETVSLIDYSVEESRPYFFWTRWIKC
ncbi:ras-related protein Rab-24-like [Lycorma delicatula]|uniref:ras-related protein Rab-24-like n=1 Tax=Lycorma delicatula TaxID=130591 RepID=UPI003F50E7C1